MKPWEFWIDVGGTFTDCIARSPDDRLVQCKVLSSAITKGRASHSAADRLSDSSRQNDPARFWVGYELRLLDARGTSCFTTRVAAFDAETGTLSTTEPLPPGLAAGTAYELASGEEAPLLAIRRVLGLPLDAPVPPVSVRLGTTRGTNALLTRRGARTAFVTTKGFADVLLIANQDRPRLFDLAIRKPEPLFEQVVEIDERLDAQGNVLKSPDASRVRDQFAALQ
jgi:5-oxoprolinase (ATP-hydrolysing)